MSEDIRPLEQLESLTPKQAEVLDLLIMHRTTKEIARELSIAPNTVDQRINAVRDKWGTTNRKDTARRYAHLLEQCGKTTCGFSRVDPQEQGASGLVLVHNHPTHQNRSRWITHKQVESLGNSRIFCLV